SHVSPLNGEVLEFASVFCSEDHPAAIELSTDEVRGAERRERRCGCDSIDRHDARDGVGHIVEHGQHSRRSAAVDLSPGYAKKNLGGHGSERDVLEITY